MPKAPPGRTAVRFLFRLVGRFPGRFLQLFQRLTEPRHFFLQALDAGAKILGTRGLVTKLSVVFACHMGNAKFRDKIELAEPSHPVIPGSSVIRANRNSLPSTS